MGQGVRKKLLAVVGGGCLALTASAEAATLTADRAVDRSCSAAERSGAAWVATKRVAAPGTSHVTARLASAGGNWDLAVFDAASGARLAASSFADGDEVAQGFAPVAGELIVQACRISGSDETAELNVEMVELTEQAPRMSLVRVATPTDEAKDALVATGLDLTEHGGEGYLDVVLHSPADGALLEDRRFTYETIEPDLLQRSLADRAADRAALRRGGGASGLPSGRTGTYRVLADYSEEMQELAEDNPKLVRYFTLPFETYEGRPVEAIEIAPKVRRKDGRPTFALMGAHHAREWPSAEHTIEFAYELINGWKSGKKPIRKLMRRSRVVFVPVVNPDGFVTSREAAVAMDAGRDAPGGDETANLILPYEYHRKNCRTHPPQPEPGGDCSQAASTGLAQFGVDPNRNYGGSWGGPGASAADTQPFGALAQDYRGPGPFSEPETRNIRDLVSKRQVVTLITNHTFSNLVLHPPGLQSYGRPVDLKQLRRLSDAMAAENGYTSQPGYALYDTSGTTEDWSYNATGGFGYTFEIGPTAFHPTYGSMIAEYTGTTSAAGDGGGNRAAYLTALRSTVKTKRHSLIRGTAPSGSFLTIKKRFKTPTSPVLDGAGEEGDVILLPERLKTTLKVRRSGRFRWHVNPSTRPLVDPRRKLPKPRSGQPSDPIAFSGAPGPSATPCADFDTEDDTCWNDHGFTVPGGPGVDNGEATVRIGWAEPLSDWDLKVFRDSDGDGSSEGETEVVGSSGSAPTSSEETTFTRPGLRRGKYVARVINYAAVAPYDGRVTFDKTKAESIKQRRETWKLTCRASKNGPVLAREKVFVKRGKRATVNLAGACRG